VDNDGNALVTGALYYRTTTPVGMKVYDGAQWLEASAAQQSLMVTYEFVATAGQTTFSGTDANGATLSYVANSISVSLNGVTLRPGDDYTATNGTSVVLTSAAALNDELMVIAFAVFNVANTYTQSQVDGFTVKLTGNQTVAGTKTFSSDVVANGLTVGRGAGAVATNTAVGASALAATTGSSSNNTALGSAAGSSLTSGARNTALGFNALLLNTTGAENTAVGGNALNKSTTASGNTALGYVALYETTIGINNVGVGLSALQNNTTASANTAVGYQAGFSNTTGAGNTALGWNAGYSTTTGQQNTFIGERSGYSNVASSNNTYLGHYSGYSTTGSNNTFIGTNSGYLITTGTKNTILGWYNGNQGGLNITTASNYIVLSDGDGNPKYYHTSNQHTLNNDNTQFTILNFAKNAVNVGRFYSDATNTRLYAEVTSNGVYLASGGTSWTSASDERKKDIVEPITNAANKVSTLRAVIGKYKTDEEGTRRSFLIAQDVQAVLPEAVDASDHDNLGVQYTDVIPLLVAAIKELKAEIDALKGQS